MKANCLKLNKAIFFSILLFFTIKPNHYAQEHAQFVEIPTVRQPTARQPKVTVQETKKFTGFTDAKGGTVDCNSFLNGDNSTYYPSKFQYLPIENRILNIQCAEEFKYACQLLQKGQDFDLYWPQRGDLCKGSKQIPPSQPTPFSPVSRPTNTNNQAYPKTNAQPTSPTSQQQNNTLPSTTKQTEIPKPISKLQPTTTQSHNPQPSIQPHTNSYQSTPQNLPNSYQNINPNNNNYNNVVNPISAMISSFVGIVSSISEILKPPTDDKKKPAQNLVSPLVSGFSIFMTGSNLGASVEKLLGFEGPFTKISNLINTVSGFLFGTEYRNPDPPQYSTGTQISPSKPHTQKPIESSNSFTRAQADEEIDRTIPELQRAKNAGAIGENIVIGEIDKYSKEGILDLLQKASPHKAKAFVDNLTPKAQQDLFNKIGGKQVYENILENNQANDAANRGNEKKPSASDSEETTKIDSSVLCYEKGRIKEYFTNEKVVKDKDHNELPKILRLPVSMKIGRAGAYKENIPLKIDVAKAKQINYTFNLDGLDIKVKETNYFSEEEAKLLIQIGLECFKSNKFAKTKINEVLAMLKKNSARIEISITELSAFHYAKEKKVVWNPYLGYKDNGCSQCPNIALFHELMHAYHYYEDADEFTKRMNNESETIAWDKEKDKPLWKNQEEMKVMKEYENKVSQAVSDCQMKQYRSDSLILYFVSYPMNCNPPSS